MSFSFILVAGAGLLLKSLQAMQAAAAGFATDGLLYGNVDLVSAGYAGARIRNFQDRLTARVQAIPGVRSMVRSKWVPFSLRRMALGATGPGAYRSGSDAPGRLK
jgi:hypothetical protein